MTNRQSIAYVDAHAAGELGRVLIGSHLLVKGSTMADKLEYAKTHLDWLRRLVLQEPRGYPAMCAVLVTAPSDPRADVGILILEQGGWRPMSGSNSMCAVTALLETGTLPMQGPTQRVVLDTAVGLVEATASIDGGKVTEVELLNVPAFVTTLDHPLEVHEIGRLPVDVVFGGQFFAQVRSEDLGIDLTPQNAPALTRAGALIRAAAREQIPVQHPDNPDIRTIDLVMIHGSSDLPGPSGRNTVVCVNGTVRYDDPATWTGALDRSPCGTGTCARMAAKHARGELALGEAFTHESILGTRFVGRLIEEVPDSPVGALRPTVAGTAWISGMGRLMLDDGDPFPEGYKLPDIWAS